MKTNTIRILTLGLGDSDGAQLTSHLHRIGYASRMEACEDANALKQAVAEEQCDLIVVEAGHSPVEPGQSAEILAQSGADIPLILFGENLFLSGADQYNDIIAADDIDRLTHSCAREFLALLNRRELQELHERLQQAEERSELLLSQSDEAIAYVADGMVIHVNERFAETFGYAATEDLECLPLIDLISAHDQERIKNALKNQLLSSDTTRVSLKGVNADGNDFDTQLTLKQASYDDEPCIQLSLGESSATGDQTASAVDPLTQFPRAELFNEQLQDVLQYGFGSDQQGALLLVSVDRYHSRRGQLGLSLSNQLVADAAVLLKNEFPKAEFGRIGDDLLACIVRDVDAETLLTLGRGICKKAEARIVEANGQSYHYTLSIGIVAITSSMKSMNSSLVIDQACQVCEDIREQAANGGIGNSVALHVRQRQRLSRDLNAMQLVDEARTDDRLRLLFQPLVSLGEDTGDHYEATLDLADAESDEIGGMELLSLVEKQGESPELDRWITVEATKRLADIHPQQPHTRLIINLSCNVFHDSEFLSWLGVALKASRLPAEALILQFNLHTVVKYIKPAQNFAEGLKKMGCQFAVHGQGGNNEQKQVLQKIEPQIVKIDNALAGEQKLDNDELKNVINAIQNVSGKAIIPDVHSAATLATLWQLGPDFIQGEYVQEPGPEMDYEFAEH